MPYMHTTDGGAEALTPAAEQMGVTRKGNRKEFAGGWLCLKPPYGLSDYFHNTNGCDADWCERRRIKRIWQCRVRGIERDLEPALREAANAARGLTQDERQHLLDAADECVRIRQRRAERLEQPVKSERERMAEIFAEQQAKGQEGLVEALTAALAKLTPGGQAETRPTSDDQPPRRRQ
jgi:hypothetical protein